MILISSLRIQCQGRVLYARRGSDDITNLGGIRITFEEACVGYNLNFKARIYSIVF